MISDPINLTTGPVALHSTVKNALTEQPISHRSNAFESIFKELKSFLGYHFKTNDVFIITGSGTLANEAMIWQIKMLREKGLILSNGEFGERLLNQASINNLDFVPYKIEWGKAFSQQEIEKVIAVNDVHWILFCHCETSTGVINNINSIVDLASQNNMKCYADCISSVGSVPVDLSKLALATASSGKGLGSIAGLAVIFSNEQVFSDGTIPNYIDLECYAEKDGIPFTISSNLVKALHAGCICKLTETNYRLIETYGGEIKYLLRKFNLLPFDNQHVFTIQSKKYLAALIAKKLEKEGVLASFQSKYLTDRNWLQLALFSYYNEQQLDAAVTVLQHHLQKMYLEKIISVAD